jgi:hypothetical protein
VLIWSCASSTSTRISFAIRSGVREGGIGVLAGHMECSHGRTRPQGKAQRLVDAATAQENTLLKLAHLG